MTPGKPKILCVDDAPVNLQILDNLLAPRGYEVHTATDGLAALEIITQEDMDLVLLDVMMPEINGFEVCRWLKEQEKFRDIPVVMITALNSTQDRIQGIEAGAADFITKPFDQGEVLARTRMLLRMKELQDARKAAYAHIDHLTGVGEAIIRDFHPLQFSLEGQMDRVMAQFLGETSEAANRPQTVLMAFTGDKGWCWHRYAQTEGRLQHQELAAPGPALPAGNTASRLLYYNQAELAGSEGQAVLRPLANFGVTPINLVGYTSPGCCLYALNYPREINRYDASVCQNLVLQSLFLQSIATQVLEVEGAFVYAMQALARAAEANDEDTGDHIIRVGEYSALLAAHLGLPDKFVAAIRIQAQMHDVGKIHTPAGILTKPGGLAPAEWEILKLHTTSGAKILGDHPRLSMARNIAVAHHERWDGSGYPCGLKGEQIPLEARITNLADQYDALRSQRPYKPAFDHATSCRILLEGDGRTQPQHFDPRVLNSFKDIVDKFKATYERWE